MVDITKVSCCLNTKEQTYPKQIIDHVTNFPFGEILILTGSNTPYRKYELFGKTKYDLIYYQDDDAICPIQQLIDMADPKMINVVMKQHHFDGYANRRMTMGLGWGSIFPKEVLKALDKYTDIYGVDELFMRDTEKILTHFVFPQNRLVLPVFDLPSAIAPDRLWRQENHWSNMDLIEQRCQQVL